MYGDAAAWAAARAAAVATGSPTSRAAACAAQARERSCPVRLPPRAKARVPSIALRGRVSAGALASNSGSTRSAQSAAQRAIRRRSSSLRVSWSTRTSCRFLRSLSLPTTPLTVPAHPGASTRGAAAVQGPLTPQAVGARRPRSVAGWGRAFGACCFAGKLPSPGGPRPGATVVEADDPYADPYAGHPRTPRRPRALFPLVMPPRGGVERPGRVDALRAIDSTARSRSVDPTSLPRQGQPLRGCRR